MNARKASGLHAFQVKLTSSTLSKGGVHVPLLKLNVRAKKGVRIALLIFHVEARLWYVHKQAPQGPPEQNAPLCGTASGGLAPIPQIGGEKLQKQNAPLCGTATPSLNVDAVEVVHTTRAVSRLKEPTPDLHPHLLARLSIT